MDNKINLEKIQELKKKFKLTKEVLAEIPKGKGDVLFVDFADKRIVGIIRDLKTDRGIVWKQ